MPGIYNNRIAFGESALFGVTFASPQGLPYLSPEYQVTYQLLSEDQASVFDEGSAESTAQDYTEWTGAVTLPTTAPRPTRGPFLYLRWSLLRGSTLIQSQIVPVEVSLDVAEEQVQEHSLYLKGTPLVLEIILPAEAETISVRVEDSSIGDIIIPEAQVSEFTNPRGGTAYKYRYVFQQTPSRLSDGQFGMLPYNVIWDYTLVGQERTTQVNFLYVLNHKTVALINTLKQTLDMGRDRDIDPTLQFTDPMLLHFSCMGLARLNGTPPVNASWSFNSLPMPAFYAVAKAAEYEALQALTLAEGRRAFTFSGASTTLDVDRTQYLQMRSADAGAWLETNLTNVKRGFIRMGAQGVLGIALGPTMNLSSGLYSQDMLTTMLSSRYGIQI